MKNKSENVLDYDIKYLLSRHDMTFLSIERFDMKLNPLQFRSA